MKIKQLSARKILNSRKEPAIEVAINKKFFASAPSGASTGANEVAAFPKKGISFAISSLNRSRELLSMNFEEFNDLASLDKYIPIWGGNTVIALQFALLKAMSEDNVWSFLNPNAKNLPIPVGNVIGGGKHTKELSTDIQEYLLIPQSKSFYENAFVNNRLHKDIGFMLKAKHMTDEGAWIPKMTDEEVFNFLHNLLETEHNTFGIKVKLGIDMAASSIWNGKAYAYRNFSKENRKMMLNKNKQIEYVNKLISGCGLHYVEDPLEENDFDGFAKIKKSTLVCGDDLVTTNLERLKEAVRKESVNCIIVKPNQIGSVTKTKEVVDFARKNDISMIISHRSGETMDATISHLAVAWDIPYIKCGIHGKERKAKLNELVKIEGEMA